MSQRHHDRKKKTKLNGTENFLNLEKSLDITYALISHLKVVKYLSCVLFCKVSKVKALLMCQCI